MRLTGRERAGFTVAAIISVIFVISIGFYIIVVIYDVPTPYLNPPPKDEPIPVPVIFTPNGFNASAWFGFAITLHTNGTLVAGNEINMTAQAVVFKGVPFHVLNFTIWFQHMLAWPPANYFKGNITAGEVNMTYDQSPGFVNEVQKDSTLNSSLVYFPYGGNFFLFFSAFVKNDTKYVYKMTDEFNATSVQVQPQSYLQSVKFNKVNEGLTIAIVYLSSIEIIKLTYSYVKKAYTGTR